MTGLEQLQQDFLAWLTSGEGRVKSAVARSEHVSRNLRLEIYRNAYHLRLLEALADAYPALHTLLGDARFQALGLDYIRSHPSHHFSIRWFGHRLGPYLRDHPQRQDHPVVAEMALFEWTLRDAFDAPDSQIAGPDDLRRLPPQLWAGMRLRLIPSVRRLDLEWNTPRLWRAIDEGASPLPPKRNPFPVGWLIWRHDLKTRYQSLEVDEAWALDATLAGTDFSGICAGLCEWIDEFHVPQHAASMIQAWIGNGLVAGVIT
jgi:hypothetical protein